MRYNFLGSTGIKVSELCLGTMTFGETPDGRPGQTNEAASHALLDQFAAAGGNFLDTADVYSGTKSEQIVGSWLEKNRRDDFVVATKVRFRSNVVPGDINAIGLSRRHILWSVEQSLKRLKTNYIDLYQIHCWDSAVGIEETLRTLNDLVRCGKVRYIGASNLTGWQLQKMIDYSRFLGLEKFVSLQAQYSLLCRQPEFELTEVCAHEGVGFLPWSPLKGGLLSGKFNRTEMPPPSSRVGWTAANDKASSQSHPGWAEFQHNEQMWEILAVLEKIGKENGKTVAQVAVRWLLQKKVVSSVVIGAKTEAQLTDNLGACGWQLTHDEMSSLEAVSAVDIPYPYEMVSRLNADRIQN